VTLVSNIYHGFESEQFDKAHPEITETSTIWKDCLCKIQDELPERPSVLDMGTGTGFASAQVLRFLGGRVARLVCQDLSLHMINKCRTRIQNSTSQAFFVCGEPECLLGAEEAFDLVVTSAVLHQIMDLRGFLDVVRRVIRPGGFYIAGQEPTKEFYENRQLYRWTQRYRKWRQLRRALSRDPYLRRLGIKSPPKSIESLTNETLLALGAITAPLPTGVIPQLVDIHVPPASGDRPFYGEFGLSPRKICQELLPDFELTSLITFPHIKDARLRMGPMWRSLDTVLSRKHPHAGANFFMIAKRQS
jgi:ubiquinone/menaquinone biosynthesis C-methylase UbiE